MTVLRAVQFHGQLCVRAVEIQNVISDHVLPTEFEAGKTSTAQCPPELLFVVREVPAQLAGDVFEAHVEMMFIVKKIFKPANDTSVLLPLLPKGGVGLPQKGGHL